MNKRKFIITSLVGFVFGLIMFKNVSYSQSKKQQIEALNFNIDSFNQVIVKERNTQKTKISSFENQESKSKQKVDSLSKEINSIENQINAKQIDKQIIESDISRLKKEIEKQRDSLIRLTKEEFKPQINFNSLEIGNQTWMTQNLNVSTFRNGDPIPEARSNEEWEKAGKESKPAWCYYDNDPKNDAKYGKLYNWYAVNDPRGLAPSGWHISTDAEWMVLIEFLGGELYAGTKMKSTNGWAYVNAIKTVGGSIITPGRPNNGTNKSGFSGFPGGCRGGSFYYLGEIGE